MKTLITGGAGFIGSHLANVLVTKGYNVTVLDNLLSQVHGEDPASTSYTFKSLSEKVHFIHGSVTNKNDIIQALQQQEIVIHLAAETGTGQSMYSIDRYTNVNISGTALLLDALVNTNHTLKKVVVASSRSIYGEGKYSSPEFGFVYPGHRSKEDMLKGDFAVKYKGATLTDVIATDEDSKIHPSSIYGITKQVQEQMVMVACNSLNIAGTALRFQNVYGPGQSLSNPYTGVLSVFSNLIKKNKPINIFEDGKESRDFIYIDDVVKALVLAIENEKSNGNIYNVGSATATSILSVAEALCKHYKQDVPLEITGNFRIGDIRHNYADITKINADLNFNPDFSFDEGISSFCEWVNNQDIKENNFSQSIAELKAKGLYN